MLRYSLICLASGLAAGFIAAAPAQALTMKECSVKYQEARKKNTLKGMKWNDFRKAECADDDANDNDASAAVQETTAPATTTAKPSARRGGPVFPRTVSQKYSSETPGKARLKTCADQYNANKTSNGNGELKWIQQGGGYWSQCNAKLKG